MVEQVYDPALGKARDAFAGEIVPAEQEKTMQRLMREEAERFRNRYNPIVDQLTPERQDAIAAMEALLQERARKEYLEAVRQNPAVIIQGILKECGDSDLIKRAFSDLNQRMENLTTAIERQKISDQIKGTQTDTLTFLSSFVEQNNILVALTCNNNNKFTTPQDLTAFDFLERMGLIPIESSSISSLVSLFSEVRKARNNNASKKPSITPAGNLIGLSSKRPGLEDVTGIITYNGDQPREIVIRGTAKVFLRIVERGQYVPYQAPTQ